MQEEIQILDKKAALYMPAAEIEETVRNIADALKLQLEGKDIVFLVVLNGAYVFAADLLREIDMDCKVSFVKLASYSGEKSTGKVKQILGINEDLAGKTVIIVEDIIDTGNTLAHLVDEVKDKHPKEIMIVGFLFKKSVYDKDLAIDYTGKIIPDKFVIGYGMDYNGYGRNLKNIYQVVH